MLYTSISLLFFVGPIQLAKVMAMAILGDAVGSAVKPSIVNLSEAANACLGADVWQRAVDLMCRTRAFSLEPDVVTYGTRIASYDRGGR